MESGHLNQRIDELEELISSAFSPLPGRRICHRYSMLGQMVYDWRQPFAMHFGTKLCMDSIPARFHSS